MLPLILHVILPQNVVSLTLPLPSDTDIVGGPKYVVTLDSVSSTKRFPLKVSRETSRRWASASQHKLHRQQEEHSVICQLFQGLGECTKIHVFGVRDGKSASSCSVQGVLIRGVLISVCPD